MIDINDVSSDLAGVPEFASASGAPKTAMSVGDQEAGFEPLKTLPAQYHNWLLSRETARMNTDASCIKSAVAEMDNVLSLAGTSPDVNDNKQLKKFFGYDGVDATGGDYIQSVMPENIIEHSPTASIDTVNCEYSLPIEKKDKTDPLNPVYSTEKAAQLPIALGGTGASSAQGAINALCGTIATESSSLGTDTVLFKRSGAVKDMNMSDFATAIFQLIESRIPGASLPRALIIPYAGAITEFQSGDDPNEEPTGCPPGFMPCDGRAVNRTGKFAQLFDIIGTTYGAGDTINTFNLPDFRECVLVGCGDATTLSDLPTTHTDINTHNSHDTYLLGQFKDDQLQNITGRIASTGNPSFQETSNMGVFQQSGDYTWGTGTAGTSQSSGRIGIMTFDASRVARTGTTTHGKQVGVNYIIKY